MTLADLPGNNIFADAQLEAIGIVAMLRRAFAGERAEIPAVGYVPDRGGYQGMARWVRAVAAPVRDEAGDVAQVILVHDDVTEAFTASERLARTRDLLEESQRSAQVGTWEGDTTSGALTWTDELYRIYGLEPGTALDYDRFLSLAHPDDRPMVEAVIAEAVREGKPFAFEYRIVRTDGSTRWVHGRGRVIRSAESAPVRLIGSAQDITDRTEAAAARERALAAQQALAEAGRAFAEAEADVPGLLEVVAERAAAAVGDGCTIWFRDDGNRLRPVASHHPDPDVLTASRAYFGQVDHDASAGLVGRVAQTGEPVFLASLDPEVLRARVHPAYRGLLERFPAFGLLAVPLQARGRVLGVIAASRTTHGRPYDAEDLALLPEFTNRAAVAIDNGRLARDT